MSRYYNSDPNTNLNIKVKLPDTLILYRKIADTEQRVTNYKCHQVNTK